MSRYVKASILAALALVNLIRGPRGSCQVHQEESSTKDCARVTEGTKHFGWQKPLPQLEKGPKAFDDTKSLPQDLFKLLS